MNELPQEYVIQCLYQYGGDPKHNKFSSTYTASCPICREGKSWLKKRRLCYIQKENYFFCHNCQRSWKPINWVKEVSGKEYREIMEEANEFGGIIMHTPKIQKVSTPKLETLPEDSINLFNKQQVNYHLKNKVVQDALLFIKKRRLNTAVNKPKALYISLKDFVHKNRLCIPFYDEYGKINFYQTRAIYKKDETERPKYLSKMNADKTLYGLDKIDSSIDTLFIFEGPIDSMFVKNGLAMGGITITRHQRSELQKYALLDKIWVLDNDLTNKNVLERMIKLIEDGESVFIWPDKFNMFKDINEACQKYGIDQISPKFFIENSYSGSEALSKLG